MGKVCFDYQDGNDTGGTPIMRRQCFCGTTACQTANKSKARICKTCCNVICDNSTIGCPWYVDRKHLEWLISELTVPTNEKVVINGRPVKPDNWTNQKPDPEPKQLSGNPGKLDTPEPVDTLHRLPPIQYPEITEIEVTADGDYVTYKKSELLAYLNRLIAGKQREEAKLWALMGDDAEKKGQRLSELNITEEVKDD